jgi:toxin ParE1/3/4
VSRRYRVVVTSRADRDLQEIGEDIARDSPVAAECWLDTLVRGAGTLSELPTRCPIIPEAEGTDRRYRHLLCGNYRIIFEIKGNRVRVLRIIHGARLFSVPARGDD